VPSSSSSRPASISARRREGERAADRDPGDPSSASSATGGVPGRARTFTGRSTDDTIARICSAVRDARGIEDVGTGLLVALQPGDGVGEIGPVVQEFLAARGDDEVAARRFGCCLDALDACTIG